MSAIDKVRPAGVDNVFFVAMEGNEFLATRSDLDDDVILYNGLMYRLWQPSTSKLASMIVKGMEIPLHKASRVLYLGAASGTTVTRVSDIVEDGLVFAVEFAPRPARDLLKAIEGRINVIPIIADARRPDRYPPFIDSGVDVHVDVIYQDVAQPGQAAIAVANARKYLKQGGHLIIAIKAKSISSTENVGDIFRDELDILEKDFEILEKTSLEPLHHGHLAVVCKYKNGPRSPA